MADDDTRFFGARRDWTLRQRFLALDSYGLLLLMILVSLVIASIGSNLHQDLLAVLRTLVLAGTFLFALHTSDAKRFMYLASLALIVIAIAALLVVLGVLFTILRRFAVHPVITGQSVLAAICVYLLIGLGYASVYGFIGAVDPPGLFGPQAGAGNNVIRM